MEIKKVSVGNYIIKGIFEVGKTYIIDGDALTITEKAKPKKKEEVLDETWVDYKKEKPTKNAFYSTKVGKEEISDYWSGNYFVYNDHLLTHWKRKKNEK